MLPEYEHLAQLGQGFRWAGEMVAAHPIKTGHINETYGVTCRAGGNEERYVLQRINRTVFPRPEEVMENIARVTAHLRDKLQQAGDPDPARRALSLVPGKDGRPFVQDASGEYWRAYRFVSSARSYEYVESPDQARAAARAFGLFQKQLADLPAPRLHDTIPNFHHTPARLAALLRAVERDEENRAAEARAEIAFVLERAEECSRLVRAQESGAVPERVAHHDTKLNNVLFDEKTAEPLCVVDLDTVMPGSVLYDFGDLIRTATCPRPEDERDLSLVKVGLPLFAGLVEGYLEAVGEVLTPAEMSLLVFSGWIITLETGMRFLTDFLEGDRYFRVHRQGHNLDRCCAQFRLARSIEERREAMEGAVAAARGR